jgi:homoserine O-succinyltransferase/O-acetyltransferase
VPKSLLNGVEMTVVVPNDKKTQNVFDHRHIPYVTQDEAQNEEIRALRIGIINVLSHTEDYEASLLQPLGRSVMQIEPVWIRLKTREYNAVDRGHLESDYVTFDEAVAKLPLDGLILAGAPLEGVDLEQVPYWQEIVRILKYARNNIPGTLGICWGALAIAAFMNIPRVHYEKKLLGVFDTRNLDESHAIMGALDDQFWCPHVRLSGVADEDLELERDKGNLLLLAYADGAGYTIAESVDQRFLMHFGNPEFEAHTLADELKQVGHEVSKMSYFDLEDPKNRWRGHGTCFFQQWVKYIHETISY